MIKLDQLSPKKYITLELINLSENAKNSKIKSIYEEISNNFEIISFLENYCLECYNKNKEYPLLTGNALIKILKQEFPNNFKNISKKIQIYQNYDDNTIEEAQNVIRDGSPLLYCLQALSKIHIREKELLLLLMISGISSAYGDKKRLVHVCCCGSSGKGKSAVMRNVSKIFSDVDIITSSSAKSLIYKSKNGKLVDKAILIYDESENSKDAASLERIFVDSEADKPTHNTVSSSLEYDEIIINEINVFWRNSVNVPEDKENQLINRYILVNIDESKEQDKLVYNKTLSEFQFGNISNESELYVSKLLTSLIKCDPKPILIPYVKMITSNDKSNRRTIRKFLSLLSSVTLFNKYNRKEMYGYIISSFEDFYISKLIWEKINQSESVQLSDKYILILAILGSKEEMEINEIADHPDINVSYATVRRRLFEMKEQGYVDFELRFEGTKKYYWRAFQKVSRVSIDISKADFNLEVFKESIFALERNIGNKSLQNFKNKENYDIEEEYYKIINEMPVFEKLKTLIEKDRILPSNVENKENSPFQHTEKSVKRDENSFELMDLV